MKKFFAAIALLALGAGTMSARELSPSEALGRLSSQTRQIRNIKAAPEAPELIFTQPDSLGIPAAYVFSNSEGLLILSADDVAAPLLGYTDAPAQASQLPPNMLAWLRDYAREIACARSAGGGAPAKTKSYAAISPLLSSKWNQSAPYNMYCPTISGAQCPTGCLATAMAQIMNYHQWPEKGTGNIDYYTRTRNVRVQCNIGNYTLDWANMLDTYTSSASTKQKQAVGRLMQVVGASLEMDYNTDASGAYGDMATTALIDNFYYDPAGAIYMREWFSAEDWQDIVYSELENSRPVLYCGSGSAGGHAFVCDGYSSNGFFHINWGWGGVSDGYFLLNALAPDDQGIGGNGMHFNDYQSINMGICRENPNPVYRLYYTSLAPSRSSAKAGASLTLGGDYYSIQNIPAGTSLSMRYVLRNLATGNDDVAIGSNLTGYSDGLSMWHGFGALSVTWPSNVPNGQYRVVAQHKIGSNDWTDLAFPQQEPTCRLYAEVSSGTATFTHTKPEVTEPDPEQPFAITAAKPASAIYVGAPYKVTIQAENPSNSDFAGTVCAAFFTPQGQLASVGTPMQLDVPVGQSGTYDYESEFAWQTNASYSPGVYSFKIIDYQAFTTGHVQELSPAVNVKVKAGAPVLCVTSWDIPSADDVDPANFQINIRLACEDGIYQHPVKFAVGDTELSTEPFRLEPGDTKTLNLKFELPYSERNLALTVTPLNGYSAEPLADPIDILVNKFIEPELELKAWNIPSADNVDPAHFQINITLSSTAGTYQNPIYFTAQGNEDGLEIESPEVSLAQGHTQTFRWKLTFPNDTPNASYSILPNSKDSEGILHTLTSQPINITVLKQEDAIDEIRVDAEARTYNLQGAKISAPRTKGVYIIVNKQGTQKILK